MPIFRKLRFWLCVGIIAAVVAFLLAIAGCSTDNNDNPSCTHIWSNESCTIQSTCSLCGEKKAAKGHTYTNATCLSPKTCTKCNHTVGSALGHIGKTTCTRCGVSLTAWEIGEYVDEFKNPTGKKYMCVASTTGSFSNSATTNSKLDAYLQIDSNDIGIILYEYGHNPVKGIFDYEQYEITLLDEKI